MFISCMVVLCLGDVWFTPCHRPTRLMSCMLAKKIDSFFSQMFIYPFWTKVRSIWRGKGRQPPIKCLTVIEVENKVQLFMNMYTSYTFYVISVNTDLDTFRHRTFIKFTYKLFTEVLTSFDMHALQQLYQV